MASLVMPMFAPDAKRSQRDSNNVSNHMQNQSSPKRSSSRSDASSTTAPVVPQSSSRSTSTARSSTQHNPQDLRPNSSSHFKTPSQPPSPRLEAAEDGEAMQVVDSSRTNHSSAETSSADAHPNHSFDFDGSAAASPPIIKIRDLRHIQSFVEDCENTIGQPRSEKEQSQQQGPNIEPQYEIAYMPISDVIEMVAGLLTKITATNDRQHDHLHRQIPPPDGSSGLSQQTSSVLAFHGKTVPSITIMSYLTRIHKYCPTTYEVFISLLVYFDRMTETVNTGRLEGMRKASEQSLDTMSSRFESGTQSQRFSTEHANMMTPPMRGNISTATLERQSSDRSTRRDLPSPPLSESDLNLSHFFVVDSFNVHRLIISAVTCASKFFSDIFYTNSRYAKACRSLHHSGVASLTRYRSKGRRTPPR